jgi:hypothetical protein
VDTSEMKMRSQTVGSQLLTIRQGSNMKVLSQLAAASVDRRSSRHCEKEQTSVNGRLLPRASHLPS